MNKHVYISADYSEQNGDRVVVDELNKWGSDNKHKVNFIDMAKVVSGTVASDEDCRICDLKAEFNRQINASSAVIFIVGDKTAVRTAGSACNRLTKEQSECRCTPYKENRSGMRSCKIFSTVIPGPNDDVGRINTYSYLRHEFEQAQKKDKTIIILYNSTRKEVSWLPAYMHEYENVAVPFWYYDEFNQKKGNYQYIKEALGFE